MSKLKIAIISILVIGLMLLVPVVNATSTNVNDLFSGTTNNALENTNGLNDIESEKVDNGNVNQILSLGNNTNNVNNTEKPGNLEKTGLENTSIVLIAICAVSAIYAYKKIRDYKA